MTSEATETEPEPEQPSDATSQVDLDGDNVATSATVYTRRKPRVRIQTEIHELETTVSRIQGWREKHMDPESTASIPSKIRDAVNVRDRPKRRGYSPEDASNSLDEIVDAALHADLDHVTVDDDWQEVAP